MTSVSIIDYGIGNLLSVARAFNHCGAEVNFISTPEEIANAQRLILPGVGAFADGIKGLQELNLIDAIKQYANCGRPFLGICLGMQLMLSLSREYGNHQGLDLIQGEVAAIPTEGIDGTPHKIPHIGWNELVPSQSGSGWGSSILKNTPSNSDVYFVHSFRVIPSNPETRVADVLYHGQNISAVIQKDQIYGCQFHPEKSGEVGLGILRQFLKV